MHGFIDYYCISGTFKAHEFLDAVEVAVLPHITPFPGPRSVVILDNASIHKKQRFIELVEERGGLVKFLPPYCWHLNPIENGFGMCRQWCMKNQALCEALGSVRAFFDEAFKSVTPAPHAVAFTLVDTCRHFIFLNVYHNIM